MIDKHVDPSEGFVIFVLERGIAIQYRHGGGCRAALDVLVKGVWVFENCNSKDNCFFAINMVIVTDYYLCEYFMRGATRATPTTSKAISSKILEENVY